MKNLLFLASVISLAVVLFGAPAPQAALNGSMYGEIYSDCIKKTDNGTVCQALYHYLYKVAKGNPLKKSACISTLKGKSVDADYAAKVCGYYFNDR